MKNVNRVQGRSLRVVFLAGLFLLTVAVSPAFAQFNDTMDTILGQEKLTMGAASFILLTGAGLLGDSSTLEQAAVALTAKIPTATAAWDQPISLGDYSFYLMQVNQMPGGLMYRLFPNGRYALRELRFLDIVQGQSFENMNLSGERAVRIMGRLLSWKENNK